MYQVPNRAELPRLEPEASSKRVVARRMQMSGPPVRRLLAFAEPPAYKRELSGSLLDPFKSAACDMLGVDAGLPVTVVGGHPQLSGYVGGHPSQRLPGERTSAVPVSSRLHQRTSRAPGKPCRPTGDTGVDVVLACSD